MGHDAEDELEQAISTMVEEVGAVDHEPGTPAGGANQEAGGPCGPRNLHLSEGQDEVPPRQGPPPNETPQEPTPEPQNPEKNSKTSTPWAPLPGQSSLPPLEEDPNVPEKIKTKKRQDVALAKVAKPDNWIERQRKARVEAAIARQEARRELLTQDREHAKTRGDRIVGGERIEDACGADEDLAPRLKPHFDPYIPPEEEAQLQAIEDMGKHGRRRSGGGTNSPLGTIVEDDVLRFLKHYAATGLYNQASYYIGRSATGMRQFEKQNPAFSALVAEAGQVYRERIAHEIHVRGVEGIVTPVFGKDGQVGWTRVYSDRLLELEAKAVWPDRYADKAPAVLPENVKFGVLIVPGLMGSPEEWEKVHGQGARGLPEPIEPGNPSPAISEQPALPKPKVTRPVGSGGRGAQGR